MKDINLLPEEERVPVTPVQTVKLDVRIPTKYIVIIAIAVAFAIGLLFAPRIYVKIQESRCENIQSRLIGKDYAQLNSLNAKYSALSATLSAKQNVINDIDKQSRQVAEILNSLELAAPKGTYYTGIQYDSKQLKISLKINETMQAAEFFANIKRVGFLKVSDQTKSFEVSSDGVLSVTFDVARKGGN